jgi:hypothetical protein
MPALQISALSPALEKLWIEGNVFCILASLLLLCFLVRNENKLQKDALNSVLSELLKLCNSAIPIESKFSLYIN